MIHVLVYSKFPKIVWWSHNVILSFLTCLVICILLSMAMNQIKKWIRYDDFMNAVAERLTTPKNTAQV